MPATAGQQIAVTPAAQSITSEAVDLTTADGQNADSSNETEQHNGTTSIISPHDDTGLQQIPETKTDGRRTSRRAAATAAKKKLKADSDAEDADDEYRPTTQSVRASTRITRSRAR